MLDFARAQRLSSGWVDDRELARGNEPAEHVEPIGESRTLRAAAAPAPAPAAVAEPADPIALLERGDRRGAVAALMDAHADVVFSLCVRVLRDRQLAEDVAQQVFLEAHRDLDRFQGRSSLRTWLLGIAGHRCQDAIKARRRRLQRIESDEQAMIEFVDPEGDPTDRLMQSRLFEALGDCLAHLSEEARMTVLLRFKSGMSYQEMEASIGAKADTLQARVARALPALRRCLESKGWDGE
jgi:RNA polymerase sigma-70 factor (ECF subfamily)